MSANIILDIIFVVVFKLAVAGVAIATIMCQALSAILVALKLIKSKECYKERTKLINEDIIM